MENRFHKKKVKIELLSILVSDIGMNGSDLRKKLDENRRINHVSIQGSIDDSSIMKHIIDALKKTRVKMIEFRHGSLSSDSLRCLSDNLKYINITTLGFGHVIDNMGMTYVGKMLKGNRITEIGLAHSGIGDIGVTLIAESLRESNVLVLNLRNNNIYSDGLNYLSYFLEFSSVITIDLSENHGFNHVEGMKCLARRLKDTNITELILDSNEITNEGILCLARFLKQTCITYLSLRHNDFGNVGFKCLAKILKDTQITHINVGFCVDYQRTITKTVASNKAKALKLRKLFERLVFQNTDTGDLEFRVPTRTKRFDLSDYLYIVQTINDNKMVRGHIFAMIKENKCHRYPNIISKVNEFVSEVTTKFNTFIKNKFNDLVQSLGSYDYVSFIKQLEHMKLYDTVEHLLLHRMLFYVDENKEILHPYIYKMLDKYKLPLFSEHLEPGKKDQIVSFYQNHEEVDGAQELIELLRLL